MKTGISAAGFEYTTLGAKGFDESSSFLTSYIKVVVPDVDPEEEDFTNWA